MGRTGRTSPRQCTGAMLLLLGLAVAATLAIWSAEPYIEWTYEGGAFLLAGWIAARRDPRFGPVLTATALLALWGFGQLAVGWTDYRYATLNGALRVAAMGATALVASQVFRAGTRARSDARWFAWFGFCTRHRQRGGILHLAGEDFLVLLESLPGCVGSVSQPQQLRPVSGAGVSREPVVGLHAARR